MDRKEEILRATMELMAENGMSGVSLGQIAEKIGIRKPSLYNHFKSKDELIAAMYQYFRDKAKEAAALTAIDYGEFVRDRTMEEALSLSIANYRHMSESKEMMQFYKIIYSARAVDSNAARIMAEETNRMVIATKTLFYALQAYGKIRTDDINMAAVSFAMTIHAMMDHQLDCTCFDDGLRQDMIPDYIKWFCGQYAVSDEKEDNKIYGGKN